jgi:hypothetical protein
MLLLNVHKFDTIQIQQVLSILIRNLNIENDCLNELEISDDLNPELELYTINDSLLRKILGVQRQCEDSSADRHIQRLWSSLLKEMSVYVDAYFEILKYKFHHLREKPKETFENLIQNGSSMITLMDFSMSIFPNSVLLQSTLALTLFACMKDAGVSINVINVLFNNIDNIDEYTRGNHLTTTIVTGMEHLPTLECHMNEFFVYPGSNLPEGYFSLATDGLLTHLVYLNDSKDFVTILNESDLPEDSVGIVSLSQKNHIGIITKHAYLYIYKIFTKQRANRKKKKLFIKYIEKIQLEQTDVTFTHNYLDIVEKSTILLFGNENNKIIFRISLRGRDINIQHVENVQETLETCQEFDEQMNQMSVRIHENKSILFAQSEAFAKTPHIVDAIWGNGDQFDMFVNPGEWWRWQNGSCSKKLLHYVHPQNERHVPLRIVSDIWPLSYFS